MGMLDMDEDGRMAEDYMHFLALERERSCEVPRELMFEILCVFRDSRQEQSGLQVDKGGSRLQ